MPLWFVLGCIGAALLTLGWLFHDMRKFYRPRKPIDVRISPEWLAQNREEIVWTATQKAKQLRAGQSRRPL